MKKTYTTPELISEKLYDIDVITASGEIDSEHDKDNAYFSISNLWNS